MTKSIYTIKRLQNHPNANARIIDTENKTFLKSYDTIVLEYDKNDKTLSCSGLYSMTTRKHISLFLRELFPTISYQDVKKAYEKNLVLKLR